MIFACRSRLRGMERKTIGIELLLSEPEIVAWLGLSDEKENERVAQLRPVALASPPDARSAEAA
jgi:hypothetical protein